MTTIPWLPEYMLVPLVLLKAAAALAALLLTLLNMLSIWRRKVLVESAARRQRMYALFGTSMLIAWSSSVQITQLTAPGPSRFVLGYEHLFSIAVCVIITYAQWTTRREDIDTVTPDA